MRYIKSIALTVVVVALVGSVVAHAGERSELERDAVVSTTDCIAKQTFRLWVSEVAHGRDENDKPGWGDDGVAIFARNARTRCSPADLFLRSATSVPAVFAVSTRHLSGSALLGFRELWSPLWLEVGRFAA